MKKIIVFMLAVTLIFAVGCGGESEAKNIPVDEIFAKIADNCDFPPMAKVDDPETAKEFFLIDIEYDKYDEVGIWQCPMSASLAEVIIIKTPDGARAKSDLNARRDKLVDVDSFYPDAKALAENSITGNWGQYFYFIAAEDAENAEKAIKAVLTE